MPGHRWVKAFFREKKSLKRRISSKGPSLSMPVTVYLMCPACLRGLLTLNSLTLGSTSSYIGSSKLTSCNLRASSSSFSCYFTFSASFLAFLSLLDVSCFTSVSTTATFSVYLTSSYFLTGSVASTFLSDAFFANGSSSSSSSSATTMGVSSNSPFLSEATVSTTIAVLCSSF